VSTSLTIANRTNLGTPIVRRDRNGVLLRYYPEALKPQNIKQPIEITDGERNDLIYAEHEVQVLKMITEHLDLSSIATARICDALDAIRGALEIVRPQLGLDRPEGEI
jgi:hypothetical protein